MRHPALQAVSVCAAVAYYLSIRRLGGLRVVAAMTGMFIVLSLANPLFNPMGDTVLFTYMGSRSFTWEALAFGVSTAAMFVSTMLWFACFNVVMTTDKLVFLFGRVAPYYKTQGDNKDTNPIADEEMQTSDTIVAVYTGTKIPAIGNIFGFIRTQLGFFLCVLLPMILFFVYEAIRVVMNLLAYNKEKTLAEAQATVQNAELTEEQKQRAIEEYLASLGQNSDSENK